MNIQVDKWGVYMRTNKNPFPKVDRVRPSHPTVANPRFGAVSARIARSGSVEIRQFNQFLDNSWLWAERHRSRDARRHSRDVLPGSVVQSNSPAWGGGTRTLSGHLLSVAEGLQLAGFDHTQLRTE